MDVSDVPPWVTTSEISIPLVRKLAEERTSITDWTCSRLAGGGGEALGVWRLAGQALTADRIQTWSMILKGWAPPAHGTDQSAWNWPHREMEMYRSGLLNDLPGGIRAPACYGETERPDGSVWLWLEDITDDTIGPWPLASYGRVARQLGRFNGAYLAGRSRPEDQCISRNWLRQWVEAAAPYVEQLVRSNDHPLVRQVYPSHVIEAYMRLWTEREASFALLDQLPQTFCHLDAFRRNLFIRKGLNGSDDTVMIDWGFAGLAGIGEELASLIAASVVFMEVPFSDAEALQALVLAEYIEGLRDAGWQGDSEIVETGYRVAAGLRYGIGAVRMMLPALLDEGSHTHMEQLFGRPMSQIIAYNADLNRWLAALHPEV